MKDFLPGNFSGWVQFFCGLALSSGIIYIFLTGDSPLISLGLSAGEAISGLTVAIVVLVAVYWITNEEKE